MYKLKISFINAILALSAFIVTISSCTKANIDFGSQWVDNDYTRIVYIDTFSTSLSTVFVDSFPTSATGYALVGKYNDPYFGKINTSTYVQFYPPAYSSALVDTFNAAEFDSITLFMKIKGSYYGDTTKDLKLNVYQLVNSIAPTTSSGSFYNTTTIAASNTILGTKTFSYKTGSPNNGDTLSIRLSNALGQELLQKLKDGSQDIQNTTLFLDYFKGVKIMADDASDASFISSFADSISLRLYYSSPGVTQRQHVYRTFDMYNSSYQFNNITIDRSGTALSSLTRQNPVIPSSQTGNEVLMQAITGSLGKVTFPTVRQVLTAPNYLRLSQAVLTFQPEFGTENPFYPLPSSLYLFPTDNGNQLGSTYIQQNIALYQEPLTYYNTYSFDITSYISSDELGNVNLNGKGLLISPTSTNFRTTFNRLVIPDLNGQKGKIQLKLYYIAVK